VTYVLLSGAFVLLACLAAFFALGRIPGPSRARAVRRWRFPLLASGIALLLLTAVFDNVMITLGFMEYSDARTSGLAIGLAPLEDFSYPLAGLILLPALWVLLGRRRSGDPHV
jgi:lycopene cyclase domain-containing protein